MSISISHFGTLRLHTCAISAASSLLPIESSVGRARSFSLSASFAAIVSMRSIDSIIGMVVVAAAAELAVSEARCNSRNHRYYSFIINEEVVLSNYRNRDSKER